MQNITFSELIFVDQKYSFDNQRIQKVSILHIYISKLSTELKMPLFKDKTKYNIDSMFFVNVIDMTHTIFLENGNCSLITNFTGWHH
jgi:hypothetical protein